MISVVYVVGHESWVNLFPIIPGSATKDKMNEAFRTVVLGGLEHPNNIAKRDKAFTAMVMDSNGKPLYVYTQNAETDAYDMKMEYGCALNMELLPSFGTPRPHALMDEG